MADISTRMSVSGLSQWRSSYQQAQNSVKTLDAELKKNEAQYKATGDKEKYLEDRTKLLKQQLEAQKKAASEAEKALKSMKDQGVDPTSRSYQEFQRKLAEAETAVLNTTVAMNNLDQSEQKAATSADKMVSSLGSIDKKVSLDQVISGVNTITKGLEDAAKAAIRFAREAWSEVMEVAGYADDISTKAMKYGVTPEEYAKRANLAATWAETSAESYYEAIHRIQYNLANISAENMGIFEAIGFNPYEAGKYGVGPLKDTEDIFWGIGDALLHMSDANKRAAYSRELFGRSWDELNPMFMMGREEYERLYAETPGNTDEEFSKLALLNDTVGTLRQKFQALEVTALSALAPALTAAAEAVGLFLDKLMEFLESEDGQKLLDELGTAVSELFADLATISPEQVVENVVSVFTSITDGLKWLVDNKGDVVEALKWIVAGWGLLKLSGGALEVLKLVTGLQFLKNGGFNAAGNGAGGDTTVVTDSAPKESKMPGILDKAVAGMATKAVLDTSFALIENSRILADKTLSREEQLTQWADAQVAAGFIRAEDRDRVIAGNSVLFLAVPEVEENASEDVSAQIGEVPVAVRPYVPGAYSAPPGDTHGGIGGGGPGSSTYYSMHANGLPWVPRDGYIAMLHRGERVMTAQENRSYTYNSNNYFGTVNLNNGMEIDALCDSIDRHNRRQHAGYGS